MTNAEGWVFAKQLEKQYKNTIYWAKMWIFVLLFIVAWVGMSLYTQWEQEKVIQKQKQGEIAKIQASFNPDTSQEKIDKLLAEKVIIKETPTTQQTENTNPINTILSEWGRETQSSKTEELKAEREQQALLKETAFVGNLCFLASKDADKKQFFNTFNYTNAHLVRGFSNKINIDSIDYKMYCFHWMKLTSKFIDNTLKKYATLKTNEEKNKYVSRVFKYLKSLSQAFYEIKFSKPTGMSDLSHFEGCWSDEVMGQVFSKIGIYPLKHKELNDGFSSGKIGGSSHCVMPNAQNIILAEKNIQVTNYYENLFKDIKTFNEMKESSYFKKWYSGLTYNQGIEKFMQYLNTAPFQWGWSVFSKGEDIKTDYVLAQHKAQIKKFFALVSQIINF